MNCCDANGKCKGGKGCPVGEPLPIQMHDDPADEGAPSWLDLIAVDRAGRHADRAWFLCGEGDGMSKLRDAAQQALEALDCIYSPLHVREINKVGAAMVALRAALAEQPAEQQPQEPVAWMCSNTELMHKGYQMFSATGGGDWNIPVYTAPQPRRNVTYVCPVCAARLERQE